jgi:hypothetical protein
LTTNSINLSLGILCGLLALPRASSLALRGISCYSPVAVHEQPTGGHLMLAESATHVEILRLIQETYARLSTPDANAAGLMSHPDMTVAGSGLGELAYGPEAVRGMAEGVSSLGYQWEPETVTVWQEGNVAWAQILGSVQVKRNDHEDHVPYWTTAVFVKHSQSWEWRYWGGSEPQASPRV